MLKATRKRRSKAEMCTSKRMRLTSESVESTSHESDLILKKYQDAAADSSVDSSATSVWLTLNTHIVTTIERFFAAATGQHGKTTAPPANALSSPRVAGRTQPSIHAAGGEKSPPAHG